MKGDIFKAFARRFEIKSFIGAGAMALSLLLAPHANADVTQIVPDRLAPAVRRLRPVGRFDATNHLRLDLALPLRDPSGLTNLLRQIYDPRSPDYRHYLTPREFTERFGPTEKDYQAVIDFARAHHLRVTATHRNRLLVDVDASVADIEKTLHVSMGLYQHPTEKRRFHAPSTNPSLDLKVPLAGISGLDDYSLARPNYHLMSADTQAAPNGNTGSGPNGTFMGKDFRAAYLPGVPLNGSGQSVAVVEFDGYTPRDITNYEIRAGLPSVTVSNVLIDGATGHPSGQGGEVEASLDIEMAIAMATNLTKVLVYIGPASTPWHDLLSQIADDDIAKQIGCSWYQPGLPGDPVSDQIFLQMAAQGQTFFTAAGDFDAESGLIGFPDDSPYITVVGGTTLTTDGPGGPYAGETVWNRRNGIGGAGGISTQYSIPGWQQSVSMADNGGSTTMRNVPDVALTSENVYVEANGTNYLVGGTSCAAPLWAGVIALANQLGASQSQPPIGFANPAFYAIGQGPQYASAFHDIIIGDNTSLNSPSHFYAIPGFDLCTGWGTPAGTNLLYALVSPQLLVLPTSGFASIGGVGGPFSTVSETFSLTNAGLGSLQWSLGSASSWLSVSANSGSLASGGAADSVTVSLNSSATNLVPGVYTALVWFTNLSTGVALNRQFVLNIGQLPAITTQPLGQTAVAGQPVAFSVSVTNAANATYQWQLDGIDIPNNTITTIAGNGSLLNSGDGGFATNAGLDNPLGAAVDAFGNVYVSDLANNRIRKIDSSGVISTFAGNGQSGFSGDAGPATNAALNNPYGVAVDGSGNVYITDLGNNRVRKVDTNGIISTVAGNGQSGFSGDGGPATNASLSFPYGLAADALGDLYVADFGNDRIRKIDTNGTITTFAGNGNVGYLGDHSLATNAALFYPLGVAADNSGNVYIADLGNNCIRKVDSLGVLTTIVGNGKLGYFGDGDAATNASLDDPYGVTIDAAGNLFIADLGNDRIREVTADGIISTIAGDGQDGYSGDNGPAAAASLDNPYSVAVDASGNLFIADTDNNRIRRVGLAGSPTLTVPSPEAADAGDYTLVIRNAWGAITSAPAHLTIVFPPEITSQPQNLTITNRGNAGFTVTASGSEPLSYQWLFDGSPLADGSEFSGALSTNLLVTSATTNDVGSYRVVISNIWGVITSSVAALNIGTWPAIVSQPQSVTVTNGVPVAFSVAVTGSQPFSFQWRLNGSPLADDNNISGSLTTNLVLAAAMTNDVGAYTLVVSNVLGAVTSAPAALTIVFPPGIISQPQSLTVTNGAPAGFAVKASGTEPLSYQWLRHGVPLVDGAEFSGSLTTNLLLTPATSNDLDGYSVVVSNQWGVITSAVANLSIGTWPAILTQPQSLTVANGSGAAFLAAVAGSQPLSFQWRKNGLNITDQFNLSGSLTTNLIVTAATTNDAGLYTLVVSNVLGAVTSAPAALTIAFPPSILTQPQTITVTNGASVDFLVQASGTEPLAYQWLRRGAPLTDGAEFSGSLTTNLLLTPATTNDIDAYSVVVSNSWGSVTSAVASLNIGTWPVILPQPQSVTVTNGSGAAFFTAVSGSQPLTFQWFRNGAALLDDGNLSGSQTPVLILNTATTNDAGAYTLVVTNVLGAVTSSPAALTIAFPPAIVIQPQSLTVTNGASAVLFVQASGTEPLSYQWLRHGAPLADGSEFSGSLTTNLLVAPATTSDIDSYSVIVSNNWGVLTSSVATLTIGSYPAILAQPLSATVTNGASVAFSVAVAGSQPLTFQWRKNGLNITDQFNLSGALTTNLTITAATTNDLGAYTLVVSNILGAVTSSPASLTIAFPPSISTQPQSLTVTNGASAGFFVQAGGDEPLSYQWLRNGAPLIDGAEFSGSLTTNLLLNPATTNDIASYSVVISNNWGVVTSAVATLTIGNWPFILAQPLSVTATNGAAAVFHAAVGGARPLAFQWRKNHIDLADGGNVSGALTTNLTLANVTTNDAGAYSLVASNVLGAVTSTPASLTLVYPPAILDQPQSLTVTNGSSAGFTVAATGTAPLSYQWLLNGASITDAAEFSGSLTTNLLLTSAATNDVGSYSVVISNAWGVLTSSVASLTIGSWPAILTQPLSATVTNGAPVVFTAAVNGSQPMSFQWRKNGLSITDDFNISGSLTTNLVLAAATIDNIGAYTLVVSNALGAITSSPANLTIAFPPGILFQPQSLTVTNGAPAGFTVRTTGTEPLSYQWLFNGAPLADAGDLEGSLTTNLSLTSVTTNEAGSYRVVVSNSWGALTSSVATLTIGSWPAILTQPAGATVTNGGSVQFSAAVAGSQPLSFQWRRNGSPLVDVGEISGAFTTNLVLTRVATNDLGAYALVVSNVLGAVTSSPASLILAFPPRLLAQPQSLTVTNGAPASFVVTAIGTRPLSYQWLLNGAPLTDGGDFSGSLTTNLSLTPATTNDAGSYSVVVSNAWGVLTSSVATLSIGSFPAILTQPLSVAVTNGSRVVFSASVAGSQPLSLQWRKNGLDITDNFNLSGSLTTNLIVSAATTNDVAAYTLVVSNSLGAVTSAPASLIIALPPAILAQPTSLTVTNGASARFAINASGAAPLFYQWFHNGLPLADGGEFSGSLTTNLFLTPATTNDAGSYSVMVSNSWGALTSAVATLTIGSFPVILVQPESVTVANGDTAAFYAGADGSQPLSFQWRKNGLDLADNANLSGSQTPLLIVVAAATNDAGAYSLVVSNSLGAVTSTPAALTIAFPPSILSQPRSLAVTNGASARFLVSASGTAPLSYQWLLDGAPLTDGAGFTGSLTTNLLLTLASTNDAGSYSVLVSNSWGALTSSVATLTVGGVPVIITQPQGVTVANGDSAAFIANAVGSQPLSFQWRKNGLDLFDNANLSGSLSTNLILTAASTNDIGSYTLVVRNPFGAVTSVPAALILALPPIILTPPQNVTIAAGGIATFTVSVLPDSPIAWQWTFNGTNIAGATNASLTLTNVLSSQAGLYAVSVTNAFGSTLSPAATLSLTVGGFLWSPIASPQLAGAPFLVTIEASDLNNHVLTNYNGSAFLDSTNGIPVAQTASNLLQVMPATATNFIDGVWSGYVVINQPVTNLVLRAGDGLSHTGLANPITVLPWPTLTIRQSGAALQFFWPSEYSGFQLISSDGPDPAGTWTLVPISPFRVGNQYLDQISAPPSNTFYRLQRAAQPPQ